MSPALKSMGTKLVQVNWSEFREGYIIHVHQSGQWLALTKEEWEDLRNMIHELCEWGVD